MGTGLVTAGVVDAAGAGFAAGAGVVAEVGATAEGCDSAGAGFTVGAVSGAAAAGFAYVFALSVADCPKNRPKEANRKIAETV